MFDDHRFTAIERLKHLPEKVRQRGLTWLMGRVSGIVNFAVYSSSMRARAIL